MKNWVVQGGRTQHCKRWSDQSQAVLQDALEYADWEMFQRSSVYISIFTSAVLSYTEFLTGETIPRRAIKVFTKQKPRVDRYVQEAKNACTSSYNARLQTCNVNVHKEVSYNLRTTVWEAKNKYRDKIETQFEQADSRRLWQSMKTVTD